MYGYEITQKVKELTLEKIQITEGALYPTLHALEAEGLVTTKTEYIGKRMRKLLMDRTTLCGIEPVYAIESFWYLFVTFLSFRSKLSRTGANVIGKNFLIGRYLFCLGIDL